MISAVSGPAEIYISGIFKTDTFKIYNENILYNANDYLLIPLPVNIWKKAIIFQIFLLIVKINKEVMSISCVILLLEYNRP